MFKKTFGLPEKKLVGAAASAEILSPALAAATMKYVNGASQGSDINNRIGRKFRWVSFSAKSTYTIDSGTDVDPSVVRVMLLLDRQCNGGTPAFSDIFTTTTAAQIVNSPINQDKLSRFRVLYDRRFPMNLFSVSANRMVTRKIYKRLKIDQWHSGTGATVADCTTNSLWWINITDNVNINIAHTFAYRMRGYDI